MRYLVWTLLTVTLVGVHGVLGAETLVFTGVHVVPMDEDRIIENQTVVILRGQIAYITPDGEAVIPEDAEVVDAAGKYLMPGLAEMHAHVPGGFSEEDAQYREDVLFLYLANGVTLARGMAGDRAHVSTREKLASGELLGPRLVAAGPGLNAGIARTPVQGVQRVREQAEAGYDFLKIFWGLSRDTFDAIAAAADASNIPFAGHVPEAVGVPRALEAGYASIDHFDGYMPTLVDPEVLEKVTGGFFGYHLAPHVEAERIRAIAEQTRAAGVWNVPTETIMYSAFAVDLATVREERTEFQYMPRDVVDGWYTWVENFRGNSDYDQAAGDAFLQVRLDLIRVMHEVGAGLLLGSDAPQWFNVPGFSLHREMAVMEKAGLSPYEVLKTGTRNAAIYLGEEEVFGRVAEGLKADLVLVEGNPLEDLKNAQQIVGVVLHGRWVPREMIDTRLAEIAARHAD